MPLRRAFFRSVLLAGCLAYLAAMSVHVAGQWLLDHPSKENLERGIRWDSRNPSLWARYARQWLFLPDSSESQRAADAYLRAATLNPLDFGNWNGLANAYLQMGDKKKAEAALRAELTAVPHSPDASWRLANFLLQEGRSPEAFPYLRAAATYERSFRVPVFDLVWRLLADPEVILRELVPSGVEARTDYLQFLLARRKLAEAYPVWKEIQTEKTMVVLSLGNAYAEALAAAGMGMEASRVWNELLDITGRTKTMPPGELLTNGDFEANLPNAGLDWHLTKGPGYKIELDEFVFQNGTRSLRVTFDGTSNPDFSGAWQAVPVEPNRDYRFQGYLKTDNITTDNGLYFGIASQGALPEERFFHSTENRVETAVWNREQLDFRTGPNTRVVLISLRRSQSRKLNSLIQGKAWIDNLSLKTR